MNNMNNFDKHIEHLDNELYGYLKQLDNELINLKHLILETDLSDSKNLESYMLMLTTTYSNLLESYDSNDEFDNKNIKPMLNKITDIIELINNIKKGNK